MEKATYIESVFDLARMIPYGRVTTYGAMADFLALGSARMVGWALNQCDFESGDVPAHRVVNRKGELSGRNYFNPPGRMQQLLEVEGIEIKADRVLDFDKLFWSPMELLIK
jgi:methylated-DNA-protein-cysteine methyltransferase related protein